MHIWNAVQKNTLKTSLTKSTERSSLTGCWLITSGWVRLLSNGKQVETIKALLHLVQVQDFQNSYCHDVVSANVSSHFALFWSQLKMHTCHKAVLIKCDICKPKYHNSTYHRQKNCPVHLTCSYWCFLYSMTGCWVQQTWQKYAWAIFWCALMC